MALIVEPAFDVGLALTAEEFDIIRYLEDTTPRDSHLWKDVERLKHNWDPEVDEEFDSTEDLIIEAMWLMNGLAIHDSIITGLSYAPAGKTNEVPLAPPKDWAMILFAPKKGTIFKPAYTSFEDLKKEFEALYGAYLPQDFNYRERIIEASYVYFYND